MYIVSSHLCYPPWGKWFFHGWSAKSWPSVITLMLPQMARLWPHPLHKLQQHVPQGTPDEQEKWGLVTLVHIWKSSYSSSLLLLCLSRTLAAMASYSLPWASCQWLSLGHWGEERATSGFFSSLAEPFWSPPSLSSFFDKVIIAVCFYPCWCAPSN